MGLRTLVKVGQVNNLSDARYCAGMGVGMLGFCIQPGQPGYVPLEEYVGLTSWLEGPKFVGEFQESATVATIRAQAQAYDVDVVQVTRPAVLAELDGLGWERILLIDVDKHPGSWEDIISTHAANAEYFLLVSGTQTDLTNSDLKQLESLAVNYPILLGYGVTPDNVEELVDDLDPRGIALLGGHELRPGFKDFDALADVLELLEDED